MYLRMNPRGALITEVPPGDPEPKHYAIEASQGQQLYYFIGAAIAFLAKLYSITKEKSYFELANHFLDFAMRCHNDVYQTDAVGKICLGCAYLYQVTPEENYRLVARRIADYLVEDQRPEGYWMRGGKPTASSSAEFCVWLGEFVRIAE